MITCTIPSRVASVEEHTGTRSDGAPYTFSTLVLEHSYVQSNGCAVTQRFECHCGSASAPKAGDEGSAECWVNSRPSQNGRLFTNLSLRKFTPAQA